MEVQGEMMIIYSMAEAPNAVKRPVHGDTWGPWVFNENNLTLELNDRGGWYVDLERITDSAKLADWIFQVNMHGYDVANFVEALEDLIHPQGTLCSCGVAKEFNPTKWLRRPRTGDQVSVEVYRRIWEQFREQHRERPSATQKENKSSKTLKMALNLVCPVGTADMPYAEIKEQLEDAYGIRLNEVPRSSHYNARKALGIEIVAVNPDLWSRPSAAKGELCQDAN